jgi:hypothetical protein
MSGHSIHQNLPGHPRFALLLILLSLLLTACIPESFAATPFDREVTNTASTLSAAATTIQFLHDGKLDRRYATSSMSIYQETLRGVAKQLPGLRGAPDDETLKPAIDSLARSQAIIEDPCLDTDNTCDWSAQVSQLEQASAQMLELAA